MFQKPHRNRKASHTARKGGLKPQENLKNGHSMIEHMVSPPPPTNPPAAGPRRRQRQKKRKKAMNAKGEYMDAERNPRFKEDKVLRNEKTVLKHKSERRKRCGISCHGGGTKATGRLAWGRKIRKDMRPI